ncbi:MAG: hypothetical protein HOP28_01065 [Gemmatimonadales bacterium]|nr:hypothetical protein [Gemmatimonadales bacterium]
MSEDRIDPETLAAFLDGRLSPAERARVLKIVAEDPEGYDLLADATRLKAELETDAGRTMRPMVGKRATGWRWWLVALPAAIAAGLAAVALWPKTDGEFSPVELAARVRVVGAAGEGSLAARLGPTWDQPGWSVSRGEGEDVIEPARAFRLGVRATDVEIALGAGDTVALRPVAAELAELAAGVDGGAAAAALYRGIVARGPSTPLAERAEAAAAVRSLMADSPWFDLGAWTEAARVALAAGEDGFVRRSGREVRRLIERLVARRDGEAVAALLRELEQARANDQLAVLQNRLDRIIVAAAR